MSKNKNYNSLKIDSSAVLAKGMAYLTNNDIIFERDSENN